MDHFSLDPVDVFSTLSDPIRLRILILLNESRKEACLCELCDVLNETSSNISRHLKSLRETGMLAARKDGRWVYHRAVQSKNFSSLFRFITKASNHYMQRSVSDVARLLERQKLRINGQCQTSIKIVSKKPFATQLPTLRSR